MEFLQDVFGDEALTFAQFDEAVKAREGVKLANLADGGYVGAEKHKALAAQMEKERGAWEAERRGFEEKLAGQAFQMRVESAIREAGGRNVKAISALLDLDGLGEEAALQEAVAELKEKEGYLFASPAAAPPYAQGTGTAPVMPDMYRQALGIR